MAQTKYSNWIWLDAEKQDCPDDPFIVLFRRKVYISAEPSRADVVISADSRYKLYVNERFVEAGPSKGDSQIWFQDEIDIAPYLKQGNNVIAVVVLRFPQNPFRGNQSIMSTAFPGLYFIGVIEDEAGRTYDISADREWKYKRDERVAIKAEASGFAPLHFYEEVHEDPEVWEWMKEKYDADFWDAAVPVPKRSVRRAVSPGNLNRRTIPYLYRRKKKFARIKRIVRSGTDHAGWNRFLDGKETITVGAGCEENVETDAGEEMTGYLYLLVRGGKSAEIELLQSEAYVQGTGSSAFKQDRADAEHGHLEGFTDRYFPAAEEGTDEKTEPLQIYSPFWFRTFRFIRLRIRCQKVPLTLVGMYYEETGYPLEVRSKVVTSDSTLGHVWDISERTLRRCMHETYEDCPFYEQLQYVMDSRAQMLYTYACSADDRLARRCLDDFRRSQRYDGTLPSAYPNTKPNVIPGFSVYYILMLYDHMMYFGDRKLIRRHMTAVENILAYFEEHVTEKGYVGKLGDVHGEGRYWSFIDWVPGWISGVPPAVRQGCLTMESLLYLLGLEKAEGLAHYIGRSEQAEEYRKRAEQLSEAVRKYCMGQDGMIQDAPGCMEYSQHCQVFGVLTGVLTRQEGRENLQRTIREKDKYAQCTVSMALYLFRALERTDLYQYTDIYWEKWREMVRRNMTTCAESDDNPRSECHAWGALALYEMPAVILGVQPAAPGFEKVRIKPVPGYLRWAAGEAATPVGSVKVAWKRRGDRLYLTYRLPAGMKIEEREEEEL